MHPQSLTTAARFPSARGSCQHHSPDLGMLSHPATGLGDALKKGKTMSKHLPMTLYYIRGITRLEASFARDISSPKSSRSSGQPA